MYLPIGNSALPELNIVKVAVVCPQFKVNKNQMRICFYFDELPLPISE